MEFLTPSALPVIPTFRIMNSEGVMEDQSREPPDVTDDQALTWYKNMLTGRFGCRLLSKKHENINRVANASTPYSSKYHGHHHV